MTTLSTGTRTVLATAAAAALVLGSAGGALAHPGKAKKSGKQEYMQLRTVDAHNGFINVNPKAKHRDLKLKANVRDTVRAADPTSVTVTLAHFDARRVPATAPLLDPMPVALALKGKAGKKSQNYRATVDGDVIAGLLATKVPVGSSVLVCISAAGLTAADGVTVKAPRRQVERKLGRDCVRVVNIDPTTTKSRSDDRAS